LCAPPNGASAGTRDIMGDVDALRNQMKELETQIENLHEALESKGTNSRRIQALDGKVFAVPVDNEHKATKLPLWTFGRPHMHAFHASWFGFFATFFSTFAPAPLAPVLKKSTTLGLKRTELAMGNLMSVTSNIICRFLMGIVCDKMGARKGLAFVLLITAPAIFGMMFVTNAAGFIACRFFIGMGLASFVACQVWCTQMFSKRIVGVANATAGGWGNLGGGVTLFAMGQIFLAFMAATGENEDLSWRLCFIVPLVLHLFGAYFALRGQDLPDGNYAALEKQGSKQKGNSSVVIKVGASNINAWILTVTYGFCFGVELTVINVATQYFYEFFALPQAEASAIASIFGLTNIAFRSLGGIMSDWGNKHFGMRGRLWTLFVWQMLEGVVCIVLGFVTLSKTAPDFVGVEDRIGFAKLSGFIENTGSQYLKVGSTESMWVPFNGTCITERISRCSSLQVEITATHRTCLDSRFDGIKKVVISEAPSPFGDGDDCVSNSGMLPLIIVLLFVFSLCVQMSEGLTYGVVPFVSRPALGVVSGMVGAGGNAGALLTNALFFTSDSLRTDLGFIYMGITILVTTCSIIFIYFPEHGSMFTKAGAIKCYDPQLIKPPAGYRGSDSMDYSKQANKPSVNSAQTV